MSKAVHTAQQYWDVRSDLFANYYKKPSLFDKMFRKAVYVRTAVALNTIKSYDHPTILDIGSGPGVNSVTWLKNSNAKGIRYGINSCLLLINGMFCRYDVLTVNREAQGVFFLL